MSCVFPGFAFLLLIAGASSAAELEAARSTPDTPLSPTARATAVANPAAPAAQRVCRMIRAIDGRAVCAPAPHQARAAAGIGFGSKPAADAGAASFARRPHAPGQYLVIGSFESRENAERWARYNDEFGTDVLPVQNHGQTIYRVLVGPLERGSAPMMQEILEAVGLGNSWPLAICNEATATGGRCSGLDEANTATVAEI